MDPPDQLPDFNEHQLCLAVFDIASQYFILLWILKPNLRRMIMVHFYDDKKNEGILFDVLKSWGKSLFSNLAKSRLVLTSLGLSAFKTSLKMNLRSKCVTHHFLNPGQGLVNCNHLRKTSKWGVPATLCRGQHTHFYNHSIHNIKCLAALVY